MGGPDPRIWDDILAHLRRNHPEMRRRWFSELKVTGLERGVLHVEVADAVQLHFLQQEWRDRFTAAAQAVTEMLITVQFHAPGQVTLLRQPAPLSTSAAAIAPLADPRRSDAIGRHGDPHADARSSGSPMTAHASHARAAAGEDFASPHASADALAPEGEVENELDALSAGDDNTAAREDQPAALVARRAGTPTPDGRFGAPAELLDPVSTLEAAPSSRPSHASASGEAGGDAAETPDGRRGPFDATPARGRAAGPRSSAAGAPAPVADRHGRDDSSRSAAVAPLAPIAPAVAESGPALPVVVHAPARSGAAAAPSPNPASAPASGRIVLGSQSINPDHTFANFIEGPNNQLAYAAAIGVANHPGTSYNPFFVHGGVGLGKTHLLQAVCQRLLNERKGIRIYYVSCDDFTNQFMEAVQAGQMANFRNQFRNIDVLVVDDIHFLSGHERTQEEFFHTFNALTQAQKQIVLSSDAAPNEIPALEDRLVSRFNSGLVARIEKPGFETRVAILRQKAEIRELDIPRDVISFIARYIDTNIRELEGALNQLQVRAEVSGTAVSLETAREIFADRAPRRTAPIPIHAIVERVAVYYGRKPFDFMGRRKMRSIAWPRQVAMYLARNLTDHSYQEIGNYFGGRDHTTVMHAMTKVDERRAEDEAVDAEVRHLESQIREAHLLGEL